MITTLFLIVHDHLHIRFDYYIKNIDHQHKTYRRKKSVTKIIKFNFKIRTFVGMHNMKNNLDDKQVHHNALLNQMLELRQNKNFEQEKKLIVSLLSL
jgi:hypothetical protein